MIHGERLCPQTRNGKANPDAKIISAIELTAPTSILLPGVPREGDDKGEGGAGRMGLSPFPRRARGIQRCKASIIFG